MATSIINNAQPRGGLLNIYKKDVTYNKQHKWHSIHLGQNINNQQKIWCNFIRNKFEIFDGTSN